MHEQADRRCQGPPTPQTRRQATKGSAESQAQNHVHFLRITCWSQKMIALVGEAWGEREEQQRQPFVGAAGYELTKMLDEAGIRRADCFITNVFNFRPQGNKIETLTGPKAQGIPGLPALIKSGHVLAQYAPELERLSNELIEVNPN